MARWFGVGLLAMGLTTWLAREAAELDAGRAIARALSIAYGVGVVLAAWGSLFGPFNALGWIAVGFNLLLGAAFGFLAFMSPNFRPASSRGRDEAHRGSRTIQSVWRRLAHGP
jgi:hypothetical protein